MPRLLNPNYALCRNYTQRRSYSPHPIFSSCIFRRLHRAGLLRGDLMPVLGPTSAVSRAELKRAAQLPRKSNVSFRVGKYLTYCKYVVRYTTILSCRNVKYNIPEISHKTRLFKRHQQIMRRINHTIIVQYQCT